MLVATCKGASGVRQPRVPNRRGGSSSPPSHNDLDREGWQVVDELGPSLLLDGSVPVTGQIARVTDFENIPAFIGGLHLTGGLFEPIIPNTIANLTEMAPDLVVPGHCTGWRAQHLVAAALPETHTSSNVGTTLTFTAA